MVWRMKAWRTIPFFEWLGIVLLLMLAAGLRFAYLTSIEHNVDHAYPVWQALRSLQTGELFLVGQWTWLPIPHGALMGYLYAPLLALSSSLYSVYGAVILLNSFGIGLSYVAARRAFGVPVALISTSLLAVNPWLIEYSKMSWPPALLPLYASLLFWLCAPLWMRQSRRAWRIIAAWVVLAWALNSTLIALLLLPALALNSLWAWRALPQRAFWLGAGIFVVLMLPYALGTLQQAPRVAEAWANFRQTSAPDQDTTERASLRLEPLQHAARLVTGRDYAQVRGTRLADAPLRQDLSRFSAGLLDFGLVVGIVGSLWVVWRRQASARLSLPLLLGFGAPILLTSYNNALIHPYYLLVTLPYGTLLAAWGIHQAYQRLSKRTLKALAGVVGVGILSLNSLNSLRFYQETAQSPSAEGLGALPLDWGTLLGAEIRRHLDADDSVYADVDEWTLNSLSQQSFTVYRNTTPDAVRLPAQGALWLTMRLPEQSPAPAPLGLSPLSQLTLTDGGELMLYRLDAPIRLPDGYTPYRVTGEKWLNLQGYALEQREGAITLRLAWQVSAPPDDLSLAFVPTLHVFNAQGERVAIVDGVSIPSAQWQAGDWLIQSLYFTAPDNTPYSLSVGQYDGVRGISLIFILPDGTYTPMIPLPETFTPRR